MAATEEFRAQVLSILAKMLGQRFVFPSLQIAATELKAAFEAFEEGRAECGKADAAALCLLESVSDQSRMIGERETGKDFGTKLAAAYCELADLRASL
ncbi:hypothetical protein ACFL59_04345 [Planctomycetota bacterium]